MTGIKINLHVQPGAAGTGFAGTFAGRLKVRLASRAVDGKANRALIEFLASYFAVPKSSIRIIAGAASRDKTVLVEGHPPVLKEKLEAAGGKAE